MAEASRRSDPSVRRIQTRLLALSLSFALFPSCGAGPETDAAPSEEPAAIPFTIQTLGFDGLEEAIAAERGEGMLLNFWAMWCGPCVAELPELGEVAREFRPEGGRVLGISYDLMVAGAETDTMEADVRAFLEKRNLDFPHIIYDEVDYEAINDRFDLFGEIPVTLAIDKNGNIVDRQRGKADKARFEEMMRRALGG